MGSERQEAARRASAARRVLPPASVLYTLAFAPHAKRVAPRTSEPKKARMQAVDCSTRQEHPTASRRSRRRRRRRPVRRECPSVCHLLVCFLTGGGRLATIWQPPPPPHRIPHEMQGNHDPSNHLQAMPRHIAVSRASPPTNCPATCDPCALMASGSTNRKASMLFPSVFSWLFFSLKTQRHQPWWMTLVSWQQHKKKKTSKKTKTTQTQHTTHSENREAGARRDGGTEESAKPKQTAA